MFKQVNSVPNLPEQEKEIIKYWKDIDIVEKVKAARKGSPEKVYYDGPITANGMPHYAHAITWTMKDVIPRYWVMTGNYVERSMGWDTKGILVEYEVEKELGFTKKEDIEEYGVDKFIQKCREFVSKYIGYIFEAETKLGRWFDESVIYSTANKDYVESVWWSLKELYEKDLLYEGYKVVAYSTRTGMTLSSHEVSEGGYQEVEDSYITVRFKLKDEKETYILAWTTTPWTIPGNLLLAIGKKVDYVKVSCEGKFYILAKSRVGDIFKDKKYELVEEVKGKDLVGKEYEPVFDYFSDKEKEGCFKIVFADHANDEDGTGVVHLAPYGEEDYDVFMNLGISMFDYLDDTAHFSSTITEYEGLFYKEVDPKIIENLESKGALFDHGTTMHRMPICYRTGTPLIYRPIKSWYVAVSKIKDKMAKENQRINWYPEHLKDGNSGIWIKNARDWAISRKRYWGTPFPLWVNDKTGEQVLIGSFAELEEKTGRNVEDPHRPFIDDFIWEDEKNGGTFRRVEEVMDVWYESGSMPFAQYHYPFENKKEFKEHMPAEYISEGPDQVRLWFYVMHVLGVALFDEIPYKNVATIGMMLDETGKKMSKSRRNYKPMDEVLDEYGGDILRYFILNSTIVNGLDGIFSADYLKEARREFFIPLWNSLKYFLIYANEYNFEPKNDKPSSSNVLDIWILTRLQETINEVHCNLEKYNIMNATKALTPFVTDLSTWFIRRSRERIKGGDMGAIHTLYYVLSQFTKLIAPFFPFISENIYEVLGLRDLNKLESVHLDFIPDIEKVAKKDLEVLEEMRKARELASVALAQRTDKGIPVRQVLSKFSVPKELSLENEYYEIVKDEINVKEVVVDDDDDDNKSLGVPVLDTEITEELKLEGLAREMVRKIQDLRKEAGFSISDRIKAYFKESTEIKKVIEKYGDEVKEKVLADTLEPSEEYRVEKL
ncbi:MAG: isoleucine--tRNA ligase [Patescibacteria group bacterium]